MAATVRKPKIAILTSPEVGKPDISPLQNAANVVFSTDVGLEKALEGAQAAFLWDVDLIDEIRANWSWTADLVWLHAAITGVETLCFPEMRDSNIVLTNAGGIYNYAVAEYVTCAVIAYERNYPRLYFQKNQCDWKPFLSSSAQGKNALIIGPGHIGRACARSLATLGMHVQAIGRHAATDDPDFERIYPTEEIEGHIGWAHHIIITAPLTPETHHLFNADLFMYCRPSVHLVNVGRGAIVDTTELVYALQQGQIGGATLDVFESEPLSPLNPLWKISSVMITPHISGEVDGFEDALIKQFVDNAVRWLRGQPLEWVVDKDKGYVSHENGRNGSSSIVV